MAEIVIGVLIVLVAFYGFVGYVIVRVLWFVLQQIVAFGEYAYEELTRPSPERKLENTSKKGHQEIHKVTNKYRRQVKEILEDV